MALIHRPPRRRLPELLPPAAVAAFSGLCPQAGRGPSISRIRCWWGSAEPRDQHFIFNPHGDALILHRQRFDAELLAKARQMGAGDFPGKAVSIAQESRRWRIVLDNGQTIQAARLLYANGRTASKSLFPKPYIGRDRLMAAALSWPTPADADLGAEMRVYAAADGWWYALSPEPGLVLAVSMLDAGSIPGVGASHPDWLLDKMPASLCAPPPLSSRSAVTLQYLAAHSQASSEPAGPGWAQAGDARISLDPLSGLGVVRALEDGRNMCRYLLSDPNSSARKRFRLQHAEEWFAAARQKQEYYNLERRFDTQFWLSRRVNLR